jgi:hypothetical protein
MLVFTEPEAQDYWLRPGESLEVRAEVELAEDVSAHYNHPCMP